MPALMTGSMWITIAVIAATFAVMASGRFRTELVVLAGCCGLVLSGVLTTNELFPALGSDAVVTVGAMFVLSAALERTGVIDSATRFLQRLPLRTEFALLAVVLPVVVGLSAFVNNTPVVVVFLPILVTLARRNDLTSSKLLIPLSFAANLGGTITLIGTSTNLVASTAGLHAGLDPIGMFELTPVGVALSAAGLIYLLFFGHRLLPRRHTVTALLDEVSGRHFLTEAFVPAGSALIGHTGDEALAHVQARGRIVELVRHGDVIFDAPGAMTLQAGDRLRINVDAASISTLKHRRSLRLHAAAVADLALGDAQETQLVECVVGPRSSFIGRTLERLELLGHEGLVILAIHRNGVNLRQRLGEIEFEHGDVLLVEATQPALAALRQRNDLLVLAGAQRLPRRRKRWIAIGLIGAVVVLSGWQLVPVSVAAIAAAILTVASGCIDAEEAYGAIDWPTLFLIAGTLAMGTALQKTHTAEVMAHVMMTHLVQLAPWVALSLVVLLASVLTNFLSHTAVAAILVPLAIEAAHVAHASPRAFLMAVTFGASACFASPIAHQTNTLVYSAGGYRFGDFVRIGLPLTMLYWILASVLIPLFWPLAAA